MSVNYLERLLALLKSYWVRVLGTAAHCELDVDVETVGMTTVDVRRSQPVIDSRHGHVAHHIHSVDVPSCRRVTCFSPLDANTHDHRSDIRISSTALHSEASQTRISPLL